MFERFAKDARGVAERAHEEARLAGARTVEAEHLLLALAADERTATGRLLAGQGLDRDGVLELLERETERSLAAVGVSLGGAGLPPRSAVPGPSPRWGASAKRALEEALVVARDRGERHIAGGHILLALLLARRGTVPRALDVGGADVRALIAGAHAAMRPAT